MAPKLRAPYSFIQLMYHMGDNIYVGGSYLAGFAVIYWYYKKMQVKENYLWENRLKANYTVVRDTDVPDPNARHLN